MQADDMRRVAAAARSACLGSVGPSGRPHNVPICFALEGDTLYSAVDWKPKRKGRLQRLENLRRRPQATVLVDHYSEDWSLLWWVRLDGQAVVLEAGIEFDRALQLLAAKYDQYRRRAPAGPVIKLSIERWSGWSAA